MEYKFNYCVKPKNLLILALLNIYNSITGLINCVFTISMVLLLFRFWGESSFIVKSLIILGVLVFPLFQPLLIYSRSRKIVSFMPNKMEMIIDDTGIDIKSGSNSRQIDYSEVSFIKKYRDMLIINTKKNQGYLLNKETLNGSKDELYNDLKNKIK